VKLDSAHNALTAHHNFNLAEVLISEYVSEIPQSFVDQEIMKSIYHGLQKRDAELLLAAVDAEIERIRTEKVKMLREKIIA
jgi:hypothetical protein